MSALALMAASDEVGSSSTSDDTVILSSHPIPGNEMNVTKVIDGLVRLGVQVVHSGIDDVHATGHAKQRSSRPSCRSPSPSGSSRCTASTATCVRHAALARTMGVPDDHVLVCEDGDQVVLTDNGLRKLEPGAGRLPLRRRHRIGDVGHGVLRDRQVLAEEGVVVVIVAVDLDAGAVVHRPRGHHPGLGPRRRGRGPARRVPPARGQELEQAAASRTPPATSRRWAASCAGPPAASSTTAPAAAR